MADGNGAGALRTPERNRFFYGKLMDERHFQMEQRHAIAARELLTRLGLGRGVLCGLDVRLVGGGIWVEPGVAIDACGRQIVVPRRVLVAHPEQPTDAHGRPAGDPVDAGEVTLCLHYHECDSEPVRALACGCDGEAECVPGVVQERYLLAIREGVPATRPGFAQETCQAIFPSRPDEDFSRRHAVYDTLGGPCPRPDDGCVVLATITLDPDADPVIDPFTYRHVLYSNATLFELLLCLSERVDACCSRRLLSLQYVSGDAQSGAPGEALPQPIVVAVVDGDGQPVEDEVVTFRALGGGGRVGDAAGFSERVQVPSAADGSAAAQWELGPEAGLNTCEGTIAGGARIAFHALSAAVSPPVIEAAWPPNGVALHDAPGDPLKAWFAQWLHTPRIELTFDRPIRAADLADPAPWLRVWRIQHFGTNEVVARRLPLTALEEGIVDVMLDEPGVIAQWSIGDLDDTAGTLARWLVQVRAHDGDADIREAAPAAQLLDPDFDGTLLERERLDFLWEMELGEERSLAEDDWDALSGVATLDGPRRSGDGQPGGRLHLWFAITEA